MPRKRPTAKIADPTAPSLFDAPRAEENVDIDEMPPAFGLAHIPTPPEGVTWVAHPRIAPGLAAKDELPDFSPIEPADPPYTSVSDLDLQLQSVARELVRRAYYLRYPEATRQAWLKKGILGNVMAFDQDTPNTPDGVIERFLGDLSGKGKQPERAAQLRTLVDALTASARARVQANPAPQSTLRAELVQAAPAAIPAPSAPDKTIRARAELPGETENASPRAETASAVAIFDPATLPASGTTRRERLEQGAAQAHRYAGLPTGDTLATAPIERAPFGVRRAGAPLQANGAPAETGPSLRRHKGGNPSTPRSSGSSRQSQAEPAIVHHAPESDRDDVRWQTASTGARIVSVPTH